MNGTRQALLRHMLAFWLACSACNAKDAEPADGSQPIDNAEMLPRLDPRTPLSQLPPECVGFAVEGLTHSPGGRVLPNKCAPFDGTHNNPYAIRCIDADPSFETPWVGDEYCILPPPAELGMQLHVGPQTYDDEAAVAPFLLAPGAEQNTYYYLKGSNDEPRHYYRSNFRMRDGSHHLIVTALNADRDDGWATNAEGSRAELTLQGQGFGGSQRTDTDRPQGTLEVPAENQGIGGSLRPRHQFSFNLHHMNRFEEAILREVWVNVWYLDASEVTKPLQGVTLFGNFQDVGVPPGEHRVLHYAAKVNGNPRLITMFGHRHAHTDRFGIWIERRSGETIRAYESFDYTDMPVYQYDSVSKNPKPDLERQIDGGHSGLLQLSDGDQLHFLCDITNRSDVMLKFANELFTGEMCIVFGTITGTGDFNAPVRVMP